MVQDLLRIFHSCSMQPKRAQPATQLINKPGPINPLNPTSYHQILGRARSLAAVTEYLAAVPEERYLELAAAVAAQRHLFMYSAEKSQALSAVDVALGTTCQCAPWLLSHFTCHGVERHIMDVRVLKLQTLVPNS